MIYHFVAQYFGGYKKEKVAKELPAPPQRIDTTDAFGQYIQACHGNMSKEQQAVVREILPLLMRIGSCSKPPKDWRSFWRVTRFSASHTHLRSVVRIWYSIAGHYALHMPDGSWQFASPGYTNLSAVRGMCWLYEEVFG